MNKVPSVNSKSSVHVISPGHFHCAPPLPFSASEASPVLSTPDSCHEKLNQNLRGNLGTTSLLIIA